MATLPVVQVELAQHRWRWLVHATRLCKPLAYSSGGVSLVVAGDAARTGEVLYAVVAEAHATSREHRPAAEGWVDEACVGQRRLLPILYVTIEGERAILAAWHRKLWLDLRPGNSQPAAATR